MRIKSLTLATLTALYSAGVAHVALAGNPHSSVFQPAQLQKLNLPSAVQIEKQQERAKQRRTAVRQQGGLNNQLKRTAVADKFSAEAGLTGEHTYVIELYDMALIARQGQLLAAGTHQGKASGAASLRPLPVNSAMLKTPGAASYALTLQQKQQAAISAASAEVGRPLDVAQQYSKVLNGFSTKLTQEEALQIAKLPVVKKITRSKIYQLVTDHGPTHIGADKAWSGNNVTSSALKGEGVVVGVLDTGINTDHPSFAAEGADGYKVINPLGSGNYLGDCAVAEFAERCNDKLIGVFSYKEITDAYSADEFQAPEKPWYEPNLAIRPRFGEDYNGHGSHTASTAAGNFLTKVPLQGASGVSGDGVNTGFTFDTVSGVAPRANVVAFQVCWPGGGGDPWAGCPGDVMIKAVEDAVTAGVDVINFSIGGSEDSPWESPMQQAFLAAHQAGIAIAAAAGNSGTDGWNELESKADNTSPWLLNVAAATHGRSVEIVNKTLTNFSGGESVPPVITGSSISGSVQGSVVLAQTLGDARCVAPFAQGTFSPDQIVVCERGENGRVAKSENVKAGGAGGFILYNTAYDSSTPEGRLYNDVYSIPGIHISAADADVLKQWLASGTGHAAEITAAEINRTIDTATADQLADFSSRGPSTYVKEHLIPSISAPGVNIFAANADDQPFTGALNASDWTMMSGTSMASPHVAGSLALLRQAHPDWSVAEIQSALQMTAAQTMRYKTASWSDEFADAGIYRAGTGRIDVASAINTGLIMHEDVENFRFADPQNGGAVRQLNMPELVNMNCRETCTWVRTVTATRDADWSVDVQTGERSFNISAVPARFSLKKGETQSIVFTAKILDSQSASHNSEQEVHGKVTFNADNPMIPQINWPVAVKYNHGNLPEALDISTHRAEGEHRLNHMNLPELMTGVYSVTAPVKAQTRLVSLLQDTDYCGFACSRELEDSTDLSLVQVPEDASRLIVEVMGRTATTAPKDQLWKGGDADVFIGFDANGDGIPQWDEEAICLSVTEAENDYCNISKPEAGQYWVVVHNFQHDSESRIEDTYKIATAVVTNQNSGELTIAGPAQHDGLSPAFIELNWDMPDAVKGDVFYSTVKIGTDTTQPTNVAEIPLTLRRGENELTFTGSQTAARAGQHIDMAMHVMQNLDGKDRELDITALIPEHLTLLPGSIKVPAAMQSSVKVDGNSFSLKATQQNSLEWARRYNVSTNATDAMCKTPDYGQQDPGGYVDLAAFGFNPDFGGMWNQNLTIPLDYFYGSSGNTALYNNFAYAKSTQLTVSPMGYIQLDSLPLFFGQHLALPFDGFPDVLIAPFWRGISFTPEHGIDWGTMATPLNIDIWNPQNNSGMTFAFTQNRQMIFEWDNARTVDSQYDFETGQNLVMNRDDLFDFEVIMNLDYHYGDGEYEIMMAYNNINFGTQRGTGSVGLKGYSGPRDSFGPLEGYSGEQFALDNLDEKITNNLVVCYDYVGPESTQFDVRFQVAVKNSAAGNNQPVKVVVARDGSVTETLEHNINVNSNIKVGAIKNYSISEDSTLDDIVVAYSDENNSNNTITVTGEHVAATVHGHQPGSTISLKPAANFHGTTTVTVKVADVLNPSDSASTSFTLNVNPQQDAPVAVPAATALNATVGQSATLDATKSFDPDGDSLSFSWTGPGTISNADKAIATVTGLSAGTHQFRLTVSDGSATSVAQVHVTVVAAAVPAAPAATSSGGSFGLFSLLLLPLIWIRRGLK